MEPLSDSDIQKIKDWLGTGSINIFGIQFSGKDTQAQFLGKSLGGKVFGGGDIIRHSNNEAVKAVIAKGNLAPQDAYLQMVLPFFSKDEFSGYPLVLSAVGRWSGEEKAVMQAAETAGHPLKAVILLNMPEKEVWRRWKISKQAEDRGNRVDDTEEGIKLRLEEFRAKTLPVIDFYRQKDLLIEIDGIKSRDEVSRMIQSELLKLAKNETS